MCRTRSDTSGLDGTREESDVGSLVLGNLLEKRVGASEPSGIEVGRRVLGKTLCVERVLEMFQGERELEVDSVSWAKDAGDQRGTYVKDNVVGGSDGGALTLHDATLHGRDVLVDGDSVDDNGAGSGGDDGGTHAWRWVVGKGKGAEASSFIKSAALRVSRCLLKVGRGEQNVISFDSILEP